MRPRGASIREGSGWAGIRMNLPDTPLFRIYRIEAESVFRKPFKQGGRATHKKPCAGFDALLVEGCRARVRQVCVHVRNRFICEQKFWSLEERPGHSRALLLATGNVSRTSMQVRTNPRSASTTAAASLSRRGKRKRVRHHG